MSKVLIIPWAFGLESGTGNNFDVLLLFSLKDTTSLISKPSLNCTLIRSQSTFIFPNLTHVTSEGSKAKDIQSWALALLPECGDFLQVIVDSVQFGGERRFSLDYDSLKRICM